MTKPLDSLFSGLLESLKESPEFSSSSESYGGDSWEPDSSDTDSDSERGIIFPNYVSKACVGFAHETKFEKAKFQDYPENSEYLAPAFSTTHNGLTYRWRLCLYPNGCEAVDEISEETGWDPGDCYLVSLLFLDGPLPKVKVRLMYAYANLPKNHHAPGRLAQVHYAEIFKDLKCKKHHCTMPWMLDWDEEFKSESEILHVCVEIKLEESYFDHEKILEQQMAAVLAQEGAVQITPVSAALWHKIETKPTENDSACLKLVVGEQKKEFFCSPRVLKMNSEYFSNMLQSSVRFQEFHKAVVNLPDKDPAAMRAVLKYIYRSELSANFVDIAEVVLPMAKEFLLPRLVLECEKVLCGQLNAQNDVRFAITAEKLGLSLLKNAALHSIAWRFDHILASADSVKELQDVKLYNKVIRVVSERSRCCGMGDN